MKARWWIDGASTAIAIAAIAVSVAPEPDPARDESTADVEAVVADDRPRAIARAAPPEAALERVAAPAAARGAEGGTGSGADAGVGAGIDSGAGPGAAAAGTGDRPSTEPPAKRPRVSPKPRDVASSSPETHAHAEQAAPAPARAEAAAPDRDAMLRKALSQRGLALDDVAAAAAVNTALVQLRAAPAAEIPRAVDAVLEAVDRIDLPPRVVRTKLDAARSKLGARAPALSAPALERLEATYLELETSYRADLSAEEKRRLVRAIAAFLATLDVSK